MRIVVRSTGVKHLPLASELAKTSIRAVYAWKGGGWFRGLLAGPHGLLILAETDSRFVRQIRLTTPPVHAWLEPRGSRRFGCEAFGSWEQPLAPLVRMSAKMQPRHGKSDAD